MIATLSPFATVTTTGALHVAAEFLQKGGLFMIPLAITSVAGMTAILYKTLALSRNRVIPNALARQLTTFQEIIATHRVEAILKELEPGHSALARLAFVAIKHYGRPQRDITLAVESAAREETARLHAGISVLDTCITIAPLLGLLGTASGLVTIFQGLSDAADHITIARGIAEALTTTIFGLAIAVPCVVAHGYFTRKIEVLTVRLESLLAELAYICQQSAPNT